MVDLAGAHDVCIVFLGVAGELHLADTHDVGIDIVAALEVGIDFSYALQVNLAIL